MPLKKLFKKRHSLESSLVQDTNKELEKLKLSFDASRKIETIKAQSESNLMASDLEMDATVHNTESLLFPSGEEENIPGKYEYLEKESEDSSTHETSVSSNLRRQSAPPESFQKTEIKTVKSASYSEQQSSSKTSTSRRRKCISESQAEDTESLEKDSHRTFQIDDGKLEDMIGRCINQIIKKSIITAVKNVNVDGICEEIIGSIKNRTHNSEDGGSSNEGNYFSDVSKYVELDESNLNYRIEDNEGLDSFVSEDESLVVSNSEDKKTETYSLGGYSADLEESMSVHSTDIEYKDQEIANGSFSEVTSKGESTKSTKTISETSITSNKEEAVKINGDEKSLSCNATELLTTIQCDSERTTIAHETEIAEYSFMSDLVNCSENANIACENYQQTQGSSDTTKIIDDQNFENGKCAEINNILDVESNLMIVSDEMGSFTLPESILSHRDSNDSVLDSVENLSLDQTIINEEEKKTNNWKVGYLHVKLPHKERGKKAHLKAWKKRCVSIQMDEFVNDPKNPCLMLSLYSAESGTARKHGATFWKSISCHKAAVYRSCSRSHKYAFTISDNSNIVIHLAADSETSSQEWMAAIRSILWPPSPVVQLEKMLYGKEFEISIVDNDFSFRAGLLGMYGYLTITGKKLILVHPQQGYVIQEWYLNTVDKFELIPQSKIEDAHKVLSMTTCSDSSTGKGEILMYCQEAVAMLQSIASTIHQILTVHIEQKGGKYEKELAEIADWLIPPTSQDGEGPEDYYKVPPRQIKSLLDIPNFIFDKPITPSTTVTCHPNESMESKSLETAKTNPTRASQDSGISAGNASEDILNCSSTSFLVGGGRFTGKSSDSELSDSYTPPRSPVIETKLKKAGNAATLQIP